MKKFASFFLTAFLLCILCLPASAANKSVTDVLNDAEKKMNGYLQIFEYRCLMIPATISPVIFADLNVEIDGNEVDFDRVASLGEPEDNKEDTILVIPNYEKYVEPTITAIMNNFPFLVIEKETLDGTNGTQIIVSLPEMTNDLCDTFEKLLNAYGTDSSQKINKLKLTTEPNLMMAGGSDADKAALDAMCDDAVSRLNTVKDKYEGYIRARHDLYIKEHPEDADESDPKAASIFSGGTLWLIIDVAAVAVAAAVVIVVVKKKKKPATANGAEVDNPEKEDE